VSFTLAIDDLNADECLVQTAVIKHRYINQRHI
jgi:hypothetical protein